MMRATRPECRARGDDVLDPAAPGPTRRVTRDDRAKRADDGRAAAMSLALALLLGTVVGGCSIPFGPGGDQSPSYQSPEDTRRERNRLYMEEQQRMERTNQFDRPGPPPDH